MHSPALINQDREPITVGDVEVAPGGRQDATVGSNRGQNVCHNRKCTVGLFVIYNHQAKVVDVRCIDVAIHIHLPSQVNGPEHDRSPISVDDVVPLHWIEKEGI